MGDEYCNNLRNTFASNIFPWYYNSHVAGPHIDEGKEFFFTHMIFDWRERKVSSVKAFELIEPILDKLKLDKENLKRIKLNLLRLQKLESKQD